MPEILVVDDSPTVVAHVTGVLERNGYRASGVGTAEQGLAVARMRKPDLIVMDVILPGMSGFQAARRMRRDPSTTRIPVILMSVRDAPSDRAWGLRQGACEYLSKPLSPATLVDAVRRNLPAEPGK